MRGRYLKLSRRLPQSPWLIDGERKGEGSVEDHPEPHFLAPRIRNQLIKCVKLHHIVDIRTIHAIRLGPTRSD